MSTYIRKYSILSYGIHTSPVHYCTYSPVLTTLAHTVTGLSVLLQMMAKFAEDDRLEQMNAQKRRMKQLEHRRAVEKLIEERRQQFQMEKVSGLRMHPLPLSTIQCTYLCTYVSPALNATSPCTFLCTYRRESWRNGEKSRDWRACVMPSSRRSVRDCFVSTQPSCSATFPKGCYGTTLTWTSLTRTSKGCTRGGRQTFLTMKGGRSHAECTLHAHMHIHTSVMHVVLVLIATCLSYCICHNLYMACITHLHT